MNVAVLVLLIGIRMGSLFVVILIVRLMGYILLILMNVRSMRRNEIHR